MAIMTVNPQAGQDIGAFLAQQDLTVNPDPTTPTAPTYGAYGTSPVNKYIPMDFVNIPNANSEAEMDNVFGVGSFVRLQRNPTGMKPSLRFTQKLRGIALMQAGIRDSGGNLAYYSMLAGNSTFARQVVGAKVSSMDLDINFESGAVMVTIAAEALYAGPADPTAAAIPAMTYGDLTLPVYYGYNAALTLNADDYTDYIKRIRISVKHEIERLPTKRVSYSLAGTPTICLVSRHLKEKMQSTSLSLELYKNLPTQNVAALCRTNPAIGIALTDDCHPGRGMTIGLTDVSFAKDSLDEGEATSLLNFSAEADARTFVLTETQAS